MAAQSVKRLYASAEWTSEGDLKAFSEYGRRRGTSVIKVQHIIIKSGGTAGNCVYPVPAVALVYCRDFF